MVDKPIQPGGARDDTRQDDTGANAAPPASVAGLHRLVLSIAYSAAIRSATKCFVPVRSRRIGIISCATRCMCRSQKLRCSQS